MDELIEDFAKKIRYAPAFVSYADIVAMTKTFVEQLSETPRVVYGFYDMHGDSTIAAPTLLSIHATLESADSEVPTNLRQYERNTNPDYIKNYAYVAIRRIEICK